MNLDIITQELHDLRKHFQAAGFDLRLVGGVVRDLVHGDVPKDIDLCTDANPAEQIAIYEKFNIRFEPTGIDHGTITVVLNGTPYEITSLRLDVETDGRRATVAYTRDWIEDLKRRDLTFNAMSLTFDGELIDPFNGRKDLEKGRVRFVGNADERIREDYLRILRWFRFVGRFCDIESTNPFTSANTEYKAIIDNMHGLSKISRERIWSEVKAILKHKTGPRIITAMACTYLPGSNYPSDSNYLCHFIDMPRQTLYHHMPKTKVTLQICNRNSPEIFMLAWTFWDRNKIMKLASDWKWSSAERAHVEWMVKHIWKNRDLRRLIAVENTPRKWVAELAAIEERDAWEQTAMVNWVFDPFPVDGNDLIKRGCKPGPQMGTLLRKLKEQWADSGYVASKEELLSTIQ